MSVHTGEKLTKKDSFLRRNLFVILAFLLPAAIMAAVFIVRQYFPFGNRMIMVVDSWHQYYPFMVEYQRMLKEGTSVLYSWNTGGGSSFLGVIGNYLGSPLYLLSYFVPSGGPWLEAFLALTVVIRLGCAGGFSAIFFRKVFRRNDLTLVYFSLMYALCAYVQGYYWNMMWLDTVALLPLVVAGVIGVLRDKKFSLYIISLALSVLFSFYIGYMVCLFVLIVSVCYTIISFVSFKESFKNAGKMVIYTLVAFMLTAFMTVPVFLALQSSDSAGAVSGFPTEYTINYGYGFKENGILHTLWAIARTVTNLLAYTRPIMMDKGLPNIACGVLSLVLLCFYITAKKIKLKEKIVSISLLGFFVLSFVINQLNYIWHGMSTPAMVYYRWSFIFSFVLVIMAYRAFTLIDSFGKKTFIFASALLTVYLGAAFFMQKKLSVAITAAGAVVIIAGFALYRAGKIKYRLLSLLLCLFVVCEMGLSAYYGAKVVGYSKNDDYPMNRTEVEELNDVAEDLSSDEEIYRTEFVKPYTLNDGALYSMYGITTFNSMVDSSYADFLGEFGLAASMVNNRYAYLETTPIVNLFMNVKYLIARDGETAVDTAHMTPVATTDECTLYENTAYVPMGFMAETELLEYELHDTWCMPLETQNEMFSKATGIDEDVLVAVEPTSELQGDKIEKLNLKEGFTHYYEVAFEELEATEDEVPVTMSVEYEIDTDGAYYGVFRSNTHDDVTVVLNGDTENEQTLNEEYTYVAALGEYKSGDTLKVEMGADPEKDTRVVYYLVCVDEDVLSRGIEKLSENTMTTTEWSDRGLTGTITVDEDGLFFTSVFYEEGWRAFVDGKEVEITPVADTFVAFELTEGEHTIELKFTPKGLYLGIGITLAGIALFILLCVVTPIIRKRRSEDLCEISSEADTAEESDGATEEEAEAITEEANSEEEALKPVSDEENASCTESEEEP